MTDIKQGKMSLRFDNDEIMENNEIDQLIVLVSTT